MTENSFNCPNELLKSVINDDQFTVEVNLKRGINPTLVTQTGFTLIGLAARSGSRKVLQFFLDYCANNRHLENSDCEFHDLTPDGMEQLQWEDEIIPTSIDTIENEWTLLFRYYIKIIEKTEEFLNTPTIRMIPNTLDGFSMAPIHHAAINGNLECVKMLIESGDCSVNTETTEGLTGLHLAGDHKPIIELLLKSRANPNKVSYVRQESPLMFAAKKGDVEWMKLLLDYGANINSFNYHDQSPLIFAVRSNQFEAVKLLIERKCRLNEIDSHGFSAITYAIKLKNKEILKVLLANGARLHPINNSLQKYLRIGSIDIVKVLVEAGANVNLRSNEQWTPLQVAVKYCDYEIVDFLISVGHARLNQSLYGDCKEIHLLMTRQYSRENFLKILNLLYTNQISLNDKTDHYGKTPLEISFISKNMAALSTVVLQGGDVNTLPIETLEHLQTNGYHELYNLIVFSGFNRHRPTSPLALKQLSRITIRRSIIAKIESDQKCFRLLDPVKDNSFIETYIDRLFDLPVSLKSYLATFDDLNLKYEASSKWPSIPIETFSFSLRNN